MNPSAREIARAAYACGRTLVGAAVFWACVVPVASAACVGDCDGNGLVTVDELLRGARMALGALPNDACVAMGNGGDRVTIGEVVAAVDSLLHGCPATPTVPLPTSSATPAVPATVTASPSETPTPSPPGTATPTATPTDTATPLPTATPTCTPTQTASPSPTVTTTPQPTPIIPPRPVYRSFPGLPIQFSIGASDPEGTTLHYAATNLPDGAQLDAGSGLFTWTPGSGQIGPFYVSLTVTNEAAPPTSASATLSFQISPPDDCVTPMCDPQAGCQNTLVSLVTPCCVAGPAPPLAQAIGDCPGGQVLFVGRNFLSGFGRLQDCDGLTVNTAGQGGTRYIRLNVEARCVRTDGAVIRAQLNTAAGNLLDATRKPSDLSLRADGYAEERSMAFPVQSANPAGLEGAAANLTITLTDANNLVLTTEVRVVLTQNVLPDLPDVSDVTPTPTASSN